ncbi:LysR family transcriptional regulator [Burkholderia sp. PAMC 26561]|uniref:LysR family transcriptional regulator n=1 Tax=Burkholderia sp. PAMC 26561 TaxID=1795043 RepID=UPI00076B1BAE|nr:LysR family transcriptional regulator [Burkholderia sp. PAMC 26561]AME23018.1 LysR family transcriptional regulator [Burkholderia sp. PAMC 26561]
MELRHLRYFLTVAQERQFTRAAARLHIQQPPLSQQIQELERELGFALFARLPRGVELTSAGAAFAVDAQGVLDALDQGVTNARRVATGQLGSVRIALTSSAAFHPLATAAIRQFRAAHPDIAIDLNEINAAGIIERMMSGRIDAAILRKPIETPAELRFDLLHEERMVLVLPVGHALLVRPKGRRPRKSDEQPQVPLKALAGEPFIFVRRPGAPGMYADFIRACEAAGFKPDVVSEVPRMSSAINLVAAGAGITLVPASMQRYQQESVVYCVVAGDEAFSAPLHLVTHRSSANPAAARFAQAVLDFVVPKTQR